MELAKQMATAATRADVAQALEQHLRATLGPRFVLIYLPDSDGRLVAVGGSAPPEVVTLPGDLPLLEDLARHGRCWMAPDAALDPAGLPLGILKPRCLVAIPDRLRRPVGLLVLGARVSDEPYVEADAARLRAAAEHAGAALEVVRLAEQLAERMDAERRADREIAIAREVQGKLFPQSAPRLRTLELAARCIQARSVGGDYYDFLDLGRDRVGFVLADVSGKGIHAALRMANLQAHVRSQAGSAPEDPLRVLRQVNRMLCESTQTGHFATLFLGVYNDASRRLTYINCGHNPPLCLRADGSCEWLAATATVLGVFEDWECTLGRLPLFPGDLLVAYSDGVTEATRGQEHFGEQRLIEVLRDRGGVSPDDLVSAVLARVQEFDAGEMSDDLTLVVARVR